MSTLILEESPREMREGLMWPRADDVAFEHIKMYLPLLRLAARQAETPGVAIQAGGNAGMHPVELAKMFDRVITFEPESLNYQCLVANIAEFPNIEAHCAAIGNSTEPVKVNTRRGLKDGELCVNTGAFQVSEGGNVPQMRIDDLGLEALDFVQLDVEGYELAALKGGEKTIKRFSPVIMVEYVDHGDDPRPFLESMGYHRIIKGTYDHVYVRQHGA